MKDKILLFRELSGIQTNKQAIQVCDRSGNETGKALSEISSDVQRAINKIGSQIDRFKTE